MTYTTDSITGVRDAASALAAKLAEKDALRARLESLHDEMDQLRGKIVARRKEAPLPRGADRELLGDVYGNVTAMTAAYQDQVDRTGAWLTNWKRSFGIPEAGRQRTPQLNAAMPKKLEPIKC